MLEARSWLHWRAASVAAAGLGALSIALGACVPGGAPAGSPAVDSNPSSSPEASAMAAPTHSPSPTALTLTSPAFADAGPIPREYTCRGQDVSPALAWRGVPPRTAALVLFVDDPDGRDWVHWSVLDLPGADGELPRPSRRPPISRGRVATTSGGSVRGGRARPRAITTTGSRSTRSRRRSASPGIPTVPRSARRWAGRSSWGK